MPRSWQINGPCLVKVQGGQHLGKAFPLGELTELGLTLEQVKVRPRFYHRDINADDYGRPPEAAPANMMAMLGEYLIQMKLVHYDRRALDVCMSESMGGTGKIDVEQLPAGVSLAPAGTLLGNGAPVLSSGNHFMQLTLTSPVGLNPYTFTSCYLTGHPMEIPLGAEKSVVLAEWRAIPFTPQLTKAEVQSSGARLVLRGT